MKAVRLVEVHQSLQMQEIPVPLIGESDVLVRVRAAGICHSDAHYRAGTASEPPVPRTLGHEIAGVVEQGHIPRTVFVSTRHHPIQRIQHYQRNRMLGVYLPD